MKNLIFSVLLAITSLAINAQELPPDLRGQLPHNPKPGKCYSRCFTYDTPFVWKEIDCAKANANNPTCKNFPQNIDCDKFMTYQQELKDKGYDVDVNGFLDHKTIKAHNKYVKQKIKEAKRQKRKAKQERSNKQ